MKIKIHRGTHQIGGIATEISTKNARIIIDMGDELSLDRNFSPSPLSIPGVTDTNGNCDAVFFTHYHGDHTGQMTKIRGGIPLYAGELAADVMLMVAKNCRVKDTALLSKIKTLRTFKGGETIVIGDIRITPWAVDHSALDSYMFLLEGDGKRVLYTGDFRMHGLRGHALPKVLRKIGKVDVLVTEGTALSRTNVKPVTERELQQKVREYMSQYKYVYVMCSSTNLERICALSKAVPRGKYFVCDEYQKGLLELVEKRLGEVSELFCNVKKTVYGDNKISEFSRRGFLMTVRDNWAFRDIVGKFDLSQSIILYSMWDGYRTVAGSTLPDFLNLCGRFETLHTSGHASVDDLKRMIEISQPDTVIPMHSDLPDRLRIICPDSNVRVLNDDEEFIL